jgi:hypothetical protein
MLPELKDSITEFDEREKQLIIQKHEADHARPMEDVFAEVIGETHDAYRAIIGIQAPPSPSGSEP